MAAVRACANAAKKTGLCLHIHTAFPVRKTMILELADILSGQIGLDPRRVVFCHMDSYSLGSGNPSARINKDGHDMMSKASGTQNGNQGYTLWPQVLKNMIADGTITPQEFHILAIDNPASILTIDHT